MIAAFLAGLWQFFLPTHLLAVGALGLAVGQGRRVVLLAPFGLGLMAGALVIASAVRETPAATPLLAIAALAGVFVVLAWRPPFWLSAALAFAAGGAIALNSPPHALTIPGAIAMQVGAGVAALGTLALVALIALRASRPWQHIGVRVVGSWIAASAILVLALRLAR
jgi:urease accessory protein